MRLGRYARLILFNRPLWGRQYRLPLAMVKLIWEIMAAVLFVEHRICEAEEIWY